MSIFCLSSVGVSLIFLLVLLLLRILLRKWWLWAPAFVLQGMFVFILCDGASLARWLAVAASTTALLLVYTRLGLLAAIACLFATYMLTDFPITADLDVWYWGNSLYALTVVAAMGAYGFYTSTTGQPLLGGTLRRDSIRVGRSRQTVSSYSVTGWPGLEPATRADARVGPGRSGPCPRRDRSR